MPLEIIRNDITKVQADAIVNTANPEVTYGYGVDSAIYNAAGAEALLEERAKIGKMSPGTAALTPAFNLQAKYIIHTVGPVWQGGKNGEADTVASCYRESLALAKERECESIAFPLIATGTYGFPKDLALRIAISEISNFLLNNDMTVYMVVYDKEAFVLSSKLFSNVRELIKESEVQHHRIRDAFNRPQMAGSAPMVCEHHYTMHDMEAIEDYQSSVEDKLKTKGATFQEHLFRIIDRKGLNDVDVYKKANIDRKLFSKIKSNVDYNPSKRTVLAFAIALELNLDETLDLLGRAGMTLSKSNDFDLIIEYCIENHITDINEINCVLFNFDQPLLGC